MKTYQASKGGRLALEFSDEPGRITSAAMLSESPQHPFLSGHEVSPDFGPEMGALLAKSASADDFVGHLRGAGYSVTEVDPLTGERVGGQPDVARDMAAPAHLVL